MVGARAAGVAGQAPPLERFAMAGDPPTVSACHMLESGSARAVALHAEPTVRGFLDGIQRSRVLGHAAGTPIIFATVAAAIQRREARRLSTWNVPLVRHLVLAAREHVGEPVWEALEASGVAPIDVADGETLPLHPLAVRARALETVAQERETLERQLAASWCRDGDGWLWIDGGISGTFAVDEHSPAFGVVKSHSTLYGEPGLLRTTLALAVGARSPAFLIRHRARRAVASWYLRLHASPGDDPLHGLVRIEIAPSAALLAETERAGFGAATDDATALADPDAPTVRALVRRVDEISTWLLAERAPVSLPDPRWHTLTYGVYACEQFLKALIGA